MNYKEKDNKKIILITGAAGFIGAALSQYLLKNGEIVGLTGDQLLREGIMVPFLGIKTPTPQAAAVMALKWDVPIYMVRVERFKGIKFKMTIENKLNFPKTQDKEKAIYEITRLISKRIEEWIEDKPEQWLWAHRRWGK